MYEMNIRNVALFDSTKEEAEDFIKGLIAATGKEWEALVLTSNQGRKNKLDNFLRYIKYFWFPLKVFIQRNKYDNIIGWQEFYGLIYAFYCRLFHVKKKNTLVIKNFIYKPKKGLIGKLYFKFMNYIATSIYVDVFICASQTNCDFCSETFKVEKNKFVFLPFGVNDFTKFIDTSKEPSNDYILSLGRSNRDWDLLIDSLKDTKYPVRIVCDELKIPDPAKNIKIYNNVWGKESYEFIYNCKCMIIPIDNGNVASGDTVLLQAMSFSKPIIITKPSCLADDYVTEGYNGLVVSKNREDIINAVEKVYEDERLYMVLSKNSRQLYLDKHSLYSYGVNVGNVMKDKKCLN